MTEPVKQPMLAPVAAGGGVVAGISSAIVALYLTGDCLVYQTRRGECREVITVSVPAVVAGIGSVVGAVGGLWTYNDKLRSPSTTRKRDKLGRYIAEEE